jgi:branched-chain amino acid transport system substrate-binding protein
MAVRQKMRTQGGKLMTTTKAVLGAPKSRREILKQASSAAGAAAILSLAPAIARAQKKTIKIGCVTPTTGPLAFFAEADPFVIPQFRHAMANGVKIGGATYNVEVIVKDSQSNPNRAAEVASDLILNDKIDLMVTAHTPETTNPVSDQCEVNEVPCISTDAPWQAWFFGRRGDPAKGFKWTYHFFFGLEAVGDLFPDMWDTIPNNKVAGVLWPNDTDGNAFADPKTGFAPIVPKRGYKLIDPGRFDPNTENFSSQIAAFKSAGVEVMTSVLVPPVFTNFWTQAAQQGLKLKVNCPGKSVEFPPIIKTLGPLAKNLCVEVWWSPTHPFSSHLTGQSSAELAAAYTKATGKPWFMVLGYKHALFEVAADVLKRSKAVEPAAIRDAILATDYQSIIGPLQWKKGPVPNVCTTMIVGGQWQQQANGGMELKIVSNKRAPIIKTNATMLPL